MNDNIFAPEKMSDLSFTQTTQHMKRYEAKQDQRDHLPNMWELAARSNKEPVIITTRKDGKKVTLTGYRKPSKYKL